LKGKISYLTEKEEVGISPALLGLSLVGFKAVDLVRFCSGDLPSNLQRPALYSSQRAEAYPGAFRKERDKQENW
jgi:hypothetical protein